LDGGLTFQIVARGATATAPDHIQAHLIVNFDIGHSRTLLKTEEEEARKKYDDHQWLQA